MRRSLSIALIVVGILIASYPLMDRGYTWYMQQKVMQEWEEDQVVEINPTQEASEDFLALQQLFQQEAEDPSEEELEEPVEATTPVVNTPPATTPKKELQSLGVLKIEKISLSLPILDGATDKNLKIGSARVKGTSDVGAIGNIAIAGHRSHTFGRFFNRLGELEIGDVITITTDKEVYKYRIYKRIVVEATDVSVLNRNNKDRILTLITCDPPVKPTHRLIFHAIQYNE